MKKILFLCTGNSCRSQMAEGWAKSLKGDFFEFYSAGTKKHGVNPRAIQVMKEVGIDISNHKSNTIDEIPVGSIDVIFTVCSDAHENCPFFPAGKIVHVGFDDPPRLTAKMNDEEKILSIYRRVRDEIKSFVGDLEAHL